MGGTGIAVDMSELAAVAAQLTGAATHARVQLHALHASAQVTLDRWQSPAGHDFATGWHDWHSGALVLIDALDAMATAIGTAGRGYAITDTSVQVAAQGTAS